MNITVIHGENIPAIELAYKEIILKLKKENLTIAKYNPDSKTSISEFLTSESLFEGDRAFVLDDVDDLTPQELEKIFKVVTGESTIVFLFNKKLGKLVLDKFPKGTVIQEMKLTENIFTFLDDFYPGNTKQVLRLLSNLLETYPPEFIIALLSRHMKDLYLLKTGNLKGKESWKIAKLSKPTRLFTEAKIVKIIKMLSIADIKSKKSEGNLSDLLDHIIVTNLE